MKTASKTYSLEEFEKLYREEYFDFDLKGHDDARDHIDAKILRGVQGSIEMAENCKNENIVSFYRKGPEVGHPFHFALNMVEFKCENCGSELYAGLVDEKTISLFERNDVKYEFEYNPEHRCIYEEGIPHHKAILNFDDELVFVNAFRNAEMNGWLFDDAPEGKEYDKEYSLSSTVGRKGITKHKEGLNVAYGTMSNMSIGIYANKDRDHFIISSPYLEDYEEYDYDQQKYDRNKKTFDYLNDNGYEKLGNISLGVWRWEATDRKTLNKNGYDESKHKPDYEDLVSVKIPSGKWELTHMFDSYDFGYNFSGPDFYSDLEIYSELKLIKE